jgi:hypothetical protein
MKLYKLVSTLAIIVAQGYEIILMRMSPPK